MIGSPYSYRVLATIAMAVLMSALFLWLAPRASDAREQQGSGKPAASPEESSAIEERQAERDREAAGQAAPERRIDKDPDGNPYVAGELIVTYEERASAAVEDGTKRKVAARVDEELAETDAEVLSFAEVKNERSEEAREQRLERKKQELESDPNVEAADYNYLREPRFTPNDPLAPQQWGLPKLRAYPSWDTARGTGATIAVIDSGIDASHPDIAGIRDSWDFINNTPTVVDRAGHGTHVAGIAAALTHNGTGIAGASPDGLLFNYKVCEEFCLDEDTIPAINEAVRLDAEVINLSLGGYAASTAFQNAVDNAWRNNVVVVAAAGNDATDRPHYPSAYPNAIAVSATNASNGDSNFSNYGTYVDVAAPGGQLGAPSSQSILSTIPVALGTYGHKNGTSMATPFVAGIAANLASQGLPATEIRRRLEATATDLGPVGKDVLFGRGLVNAHAAATNDTAPLIRYLNPAPNTTTTNRAPLIGATITDAQTRTLSRNSIQLFVDGRKITTFSFVNGRLGYRPRLAPGVHRVSIYVADPQGMSARSGWSFRVR